MFSCVIVLKENSSKVKNFQSGALEDKYFRTKIIEGLMILKNISKNRKFSSKRTLKQFIEKRRENSIQTGNIGP